MLYGSYQDLYTQLKGFIPADRLIEDDLRTLTYGTDASFYRLIPKIVIKTETESEISRIVQLCNSLSLPYTFRAAGTSLSGQAISDSVLISIGNSWKKYSISEDASRITLQPGVVGAHANIFLAPYKRKIGPDPASINSAMIGGIAANNASGMCCGTSQNSYRTIADMRIIFSDGFILDTADATSRSEFLKSHAELVRRICALAEKTRNDQALSDRIRRKFRMKNTTGYSLNALVDFDDPVEIIKHLMIGSEGTLGFIASVTYNTVPEYGHKATSLMLFPDTELTCRAVAILKDANADAVEFMDRASLASIEDKEGMPDYIKSLGEDVAALLVDFRGETKEQLDEKLRNAVEALRDIPTVMPVSFTFDAAEYKKLWDIRKGLFPSIGAMRKTGTTVIIEDVAFPVDRLAEATIELQRLFRKHGYYDAIIYGHALEGNWHFVFKQDFNSDAEVTRYKNFIDDVTKLVVESYDGSLKAEHGTGRNMAPFVEYEWGQQAYELMKEIKNIFDPHSLINPGVIINPDPQAHLKDLKPMPAANKIVDKCIECGFCEVNCPSRDLTLTPRQRIVAWREISHLKATGHEPHRLAGLLDSYDYYGDQTCATDGLCATSCPVEINTGNLIKELRHDKISPAADGVASVLSGKMGAVTAGMRVALNSVDLIHRILGTSVMETLSAAARKLSFNKIPLWNRYMPSGASLTAIHKASAHDDGSPAVVYFPSCINRSMGPSKFSSEKTSLVDKTVSLLEKSGYRVIFPDRLNDLCCGMAFASKGYKKQGDKKTTELLDSLLRASENGKYPVLFDMSPCLYRTREFISAQLRDRKNSTAAPELTALHIYEPVEFILEYAAPRLEFRKVNRTITVHSTCSSTKMGLADKLKTLAGMCVTEVIVPQGVGCCGWAGDRGFTYPELNASALKELHHSIPDNCSAGYSTSRTCEIGLSMHSGINYESIVYLVDECTVPKA